MQVIIGIDPHKGSQTAVAIGDDEDVPATLAAGTRLLSSNRSLKNDPNDATSMAITALRIRR